jgi:AsmA family
MIKSSPFLLLVATIVVVMSALAAFWITLMPQRMLAQFAEHLQQEQGLTLDARHPRLHFDGGWVLQLEAVTLADANSATSLSVRDMSMDIGIATLLGGAVSADTLTLNAPVLTMDVSNQGKPLALPARHILFREGTLKLRDSVRKGGIGFSDVNGSISLDAAAKLDVSFMQNGVVTTLVADAESADRLLIDGSPTDILLSAKGKIISFSGRARFSAGLALDGQVRLEGQDTGSTLAWLGMPLILFQDAGAIAVTSGLSTTGLSATFNGLTTKIGATEIHGLANLQAGSDRAKLTGDLTMAKLSLLTPGNVLARPWSEAPLPVADLTALDADLKLKAEHLSLRGHDLGVADVTVTLADGKAQMGLALSGSKLDVSLTPQNSAVLLDTQMEAKAVETKTLLGGLFGFDGLSGLADVTMRTSATGVSPAALVGSAKGTLSFASKDASLAGVELAALLADPHEGWQSSNVLKTLGVQFNLAAQIDDGIAMVSEADIAFSGTALKATGEIDLLRQAFNLALTPKGKVQSLIGTWTLPLFAADAGAAPGLRPVSAPGN